MLAWANELEDLRREWQKAKPSLCPHFHFDVPQIKNELTVLKYEDTILLSLCILAHLIPLMLLELSKPLKLENTTAWSSSTDN